MGIRVSIWDLNSDIKSQFGLCIQLSMDWVWEKSGQQKQRMKILSKNKKPGLERHKPITSPCSILAIEVTETGLFSCEN